MKRLLWLLLLLPLQVPAQLIFDFGIGPQAGVFRFSAHQDFYAIDSLQNPYVKLDTLDHFAIKAPNGTRAGIRAVAACTLTTPDAGFFLTATTNFQFQIASFKTYEPDFVGISAPMHNPPTEWSRREDIRPYRAFSTALPLMLCLNYSPEPDDATIYFGLGASYNSYTRMEMQERKTIPVRAVADHRNGNWCTTYEVEYQLRSFVLLEGQLGFVWTNYRGGHSEVFVNGSYGKGQQFNLQLGYLWRFDFYRD